LSIECFHLNSAEEFSRKKGTTGLRCSKGLGWKAKFLQLSPEPQVTMGVGCDSSQQCCLNVTGATQLTVQVICSVQCLVLCQLRSLCGSWVRGYVCYYEAWLPSTVLKMEQHRRL